MFLRGGTTEIDHVSLPSLKVIRKEHKVKMDKQWRYTLVNERDVFFVENFSVNCGVLESFFDSMS